MPAKQKLSQRKALRSAAAKKGWETRRANANGYPWIASGKWIEWPKPTTSVAPGVRFFFQDAPPPDPTPATPNWLHRIWAKITGTA